MIFKEYGIHGNPAVILIHGGGLADWMWRPQIEALKKAFSSLLRFWTGMGKKATLPLNQFQKVRRSSFAI